MGVSRREQPESVLQGHVIGQRTRESVYEVPGGSSLSANDLEVGDFIPEATTFVITSSKAIPDKTVGEASRIRVFGVKPVTLTGANPFGGGLVELTRTRGTVQVGEEKWDAIRTFICSNTQAIGQQQALWDTRFPGIGGAFSPRVRKTDVENDWIPGFARLTVMYKTIRDVGRAVLIAKTRERKSGKLTRVKDKNGKDQIISGPTLEGTYFKIQSGDDSLIDPFQEIVFQTAFKMPGFQFDTFNRLFRHVNKSTLRNFGRARPGTLLFLGVDTPGYNWGDDIINADLHFLWSGNNVTWNEMLITQEGIWLAQRLPKYTRNTAGKVTVIANGFTEGMMWHPLKPDDLGSTTLLPTSPITVPRYPAGNFSPFDDFIVL